MGSECDLAPATLESDNLSENGGQEKVGRIAMVGPIRDMK